MISVALKLLIIHCGDKEIAMDSERNYYALQFKDDKCSKYAIYYSGDEDGFICEDGKLAFFDSLTLLHDYCRTHDIVLEDDGETDFVYDIAYIENQMNSPADELDCSAILSFWNIISDALKDMGIAFSGDLRDEMTDRIYDKLFCGCNLPAYNTSGKEYIPVWSAEETEAMRKILSQYKLF